MEETNIFDTFSKKNYKEKTKEFPLKYLTLEQIRNFIKNWAPEYGEDLLTNQLKNIEILVEKDFSNIKSFKELFNIKVWIKANESIYNILFKDLTFSKVDNLNDYTIELCHKNLIGKCICIRYYFYYLLKLVRDSEEYLDILPADEILQLYNYEYNGKEFINKGLFKAKPKYIEIFNNMISDEDNQGLSKILLYCIQIDNNKRSYRDLFINRFDLAVERNLYMIFNNLALTINDLDEYVTLFTETTIYYCICTQAFIKKDTLPHNCSLTKFYIDNFNRSFIYKDYLTLYRAKSSEDLLDFVKNQKHIMNYPALIKELLPINEDIHLNIFNDFFVNLISLLELIIDEDLNNKNFGEYIQNIWVEYLEEFDINTQAKFKNTMLFLNNNELYNNIHNHKPKTKYVLEVEVEDEKESIKWKNYIDYQLIKYGYRMSKR